MIPLRWVRVVLTFLGVCLLLGVFSAGFDAAVRLLAGAPPPEDQLQFLVCAFAIATFPWVAPKVLPLVARGRMPADAAQTTRVLVALGRLNRADEASSPRIYMLESTKFFAVAVGHRRASAVFFSSSMVDALGDRDLETVLAHELGHIRLNHQAKSTLYVAGLFLAKAFFTLGLPFVVGAYLLYMALLRLHEFQADEYAARLAGEPALRSMLAAVARLAGVRSEQSGRKGEPESPFLKLLSTHPSYADRIGRSLARAP